MITMQDGPLFTGVGVALVTLFDAAGEVDPPATADHAVRLVELGVRAVVVAGSTGEAAALSLEERVSLLEAVRAKLPDEIPLIAGTGAPSSRQAVTLTSAALDVGADAVLVLSPMGAADPRPYYEAAFKAAGDMPVIAYHWPAMSPPGIPLSYLRELPIAGCKDSSGDPERLLDTITSWDGPLFVGSSAILSFAGLLGCPGAILGLANAAPEGCIAAFDGDFSAQRELFVAHKRATADFPAGIKSLTAERFGTSTVTRIP
jgi:4-hydroxy-tetrahydrodipicolinate synthase